MRFGVVEFEGGYPTGDTVALLYDELDFQRAVQAYLWALPMVSYGAMAEALAELGAGPNTVTISPNSAEQQQLVLTGNQDTVYMSSFLDLRDGPIVMDLPAGLLGTLDNVWQQPIVDLGGPFSPEQDRGGRMLLLPPGCDGPLPRVHHHVVHSDTNVCVWYLRGIPRTKADFPALVALMKTYRQYRMSDAQNPPRTEFIDTSGLEADFLANEGLEYFESLARYISQNPPRSQDMAMLGALETLGIVHGRSFSPDDRLKGILGEAAVVGRAMAKTVAWRPRLDDATLYAYPGSRKWKKLFVVEDVTFHTPDFLMVDARARWGFEAVGTSYSMSLAVPGRGSQYIAAYVDEVDNWLMGDKTYSVHLPPGIPANLFWSITAYDNETRSQITNELGRPLVGSVHGAQLNDDGSHDLWFGPVQPDDVPKANWVQTKPGLGWFAYLRLYGPEQPWFDKSWIPGDMIPIN